jgi:hypothetical protein
MNRLLWIAVLTFALSVPALAKPKPNAGRKPASSPPDRAVQYGGDPDYDACGSSGLTLVTTIVGKGYKFEKIEANTHVVSCDSEEGWTGIVWGSKGQDCGTGSTVKDRKDYTGPCKSGWIKSEFYLMQAG